MFGEEASDADLAEVVDPAAELVDGGVEAVGVLVDEGEEHLLAPLLVTPPPPGGRDAGDLLGCFVGGGGVDDAVLAEAFVERGEHLR